MRKQECRVVAHLLAGAGLCAFLAGCGGSPAATPNSSTSQPASMSVSPSSVAFGNQTVGITSTPQTAVVRNDSMVSFTVTSVSVTGPFAASGFSGRTALNPNQQLSLSVTFSPGATGAVSGTLTIASTASNSPLTVGLSGTGVQATISLSSSSLTFGNQTVGTTSAAQSVTLANTGSAALTVSSVTITGSDSGDFAQTNTCGSSVAAGASCTISVTFTPAAIGTRTAAITISGNASNSPQSISLTGTGVTASSPAVSVSPSSVVFGNQAVGTTSGAQTIMVSNVGSAPFTVTSVSVTQGTPFAVSGFSSATTLNPNQQLSLSVTFAPTSAATFTGTLTISFDVLPNSIVNLSGTGTAPGVLAITTTSLPAATASANYLAFLQASGGVTPLTWSVASGSTLPSGLTLDPTTGIISGVAPAETVPTTLSFTIQVMDSNSPPQGAAQALTLTVDLPTGANCNQIFIDVGNTTPPPTSPGPHVIPLNDLGAGTYLGQEGGLYPNGSNVRPATYDQTGVNLANSIVPLDANGNPDATNGKYVLLSIGMSNAEGEFGRFINDLEGDTSLDSHLVVVNGAQAGCGAGSFANQDTCWNTITTTILPSNNVTANQVVAVWIKEAIATPIATQPFPNDTTTQLQGFLERIAQRTLSFFPNVKLAYFSSRIYAGYATTAQNPEAFAYESGFAVEWAVQDSINGNLTGAPWLSWGPYLWANGLLPRSDDLVWTCQDLVQDGTHPSTSGSEKVAQMLIKFFKNDDTTTPWFLAH